MASQPMIVGTMLADRFVIEQIAGSGGMSTVYRAHDKRSGNLVALKLLHEATVSPQTISRLAVEAQVLAELRHPAIVSYIAHGQTASGQPFLAMEWLEGEDLARRLARLPLSLRESMTLLRCVASALAAAHRRGIVHRDIKPSNLFLRDGDVEKVMLLDFGVARRLVHPTSLTKTGALVGTPEYMAPEQARGQRDVDSSVDIFSLGSVLFECITGQPPFVGTHLSAQLAKVLFDEVPLLRSLCPEVPEALEDLVKRMLSKDPAARPRDGDQLLAELEGLRNLSFDTTPLVHVLPKLQSRWLTQEEHLVSVIMADRLMNADGMGTLAQDELTNDERTERVLVQHTLSQLGAQIEWLPDNSLVAYLGTGGTAGDQAMRATRCALYMKDRWPKALVALATGRARFNERLPIGEAIDRAAEFVYLHTVRDGLERDKRLGAVFLDELTAGLIEPYFVVEQVGPALFWVRQARDVGDDLRSLHGKLTPCVGRERELKLLSATFAETVEESAARAVVISAEPGFGKSRLRHEFLRRLLALPQEITLLFGCGNPIGVHAGYGVLGQGLRRLSGVIDGESRALGQERLLQRLGLHLEPAVRQRTVEFLGELCGLPFASEHSQALRTARAEPAQMSDLIAQALLQFLKAESNVNPVLLILEDLQWSDNLSVRLVDLALRELCNQPLFVLGLSRPELSNRFPRLWSGHHVIELRLDPLPRNASLLLVRSVLDANINEATVERIVDQARGNPLYLEELLRTVGDGKGDELPGTLLAMLQARLMILPAEFRRVLRAGSLFGQTFTAAGVKALLESEASGDSIDRALQLLLDAEMLTQERQSGAGSDQYGFRQPLFQEAAYSLLAAKDRRIGHRLAGIFLEENGEASQGVLATHAELAGDPQRAVVYHLRAAEVALQANDIEGVQAAYQRGMACGAQGEQLGALCALAARGAMLTLDLATAHALAEQALPLLNVKSPLWSNAISILLLTLDQQDSPERIAILMQRFEAALPAQQDLSSYTETLSRMAMGCSVAGLTGPTERCLERIEVSVKEHPDQTLKAAGQQYLARGFYFWLGQPSLFGAYCAMEESIVQFQIAKQPVFVADAKILRAELLTELGQPAEAEAQLRALIEQGGHPQMVEQRLRLFLAHARFRQAAPDLAELAALTQEALRLDSTFLVGFGHCLLSKIRLAQGQIEEAARAARTALTLSRNAKALLPLTCAQLTRVLLVQGHLLDAQHVAAEGVQAADFLNGGAWEIDAWLALVEAQEECDYHERACVELRQAWRRLQVRIAALPDEEWRQPFLRGVAENARIVELMRSWQLEDKLEITDG